MCLCPVLHSIADIPVHKQLSEIERFDREQQALSNILPSSFDMLRARAREVHGCGQIIYLLSDILVRDIMND